MNMMQNKQSKKFAAVMRILTVALPVFAVLVLPAAAQGRRDIPAAEGGSDNGDFPPAPKDPAQTTQPPTTQSSPPQDNGANTNQTGNQMPDGNTNSSGGAPLWPSVAAEPPQNNDGNNGSQGNAQLQNLNMTAPDQTIRKLQNQVQILKDRVDDLEFRQLKMESSGNSGQAQAMSPQALQENADKTVSALSPEAAAARAKANDEENYTVPADINADALFQLGQDFMAQGRYAKAALVWRAFEARFDQDKRAAAANYALGECYYARGLYGKAAETYLSVRNRYPNADIAPQNLLKLALSMANLSDNATACATLDTLMQKYPHADAHVLQQAQQTNMRLQCP